MNEFKFCEFKQYELKYAPNSILVLKYETDNEGYPIMDVKSINDFVNNICDNIKNVIVIPDKINTEVWDKNELLQWKKEIEKLLNKMENDTYER